MTLHPDFQLIPTTLHEALLTVPATKADAASHMITTGGLSLSQATIEVAIDRIITDLFNQLILITNNYATLLAKHQLVPAAAALRELQTSGEFMLLEHEKALAETLIVDAAAEWTGLTQGQKDAVPNIKAAGDEGITALNARILEIDIEILRINNRRNLGF